MHYFHRVFLVGVRGEFYAIDGSSASVSNHAVELQLSFVEIKRYAVGFIKVTTSTLCVPSSSKKAA